MESYVVFKDLAIIIIAAKFLGIVARKCKAPQVVGEIIAGLVIGPCLLGWVSQSDFLVQMAEIGVILLMFSAGLGTDLKELLKTGPIAFLIACCGVCCLQRRKQWLIAVPTLVLAVGLWLGTPVYAWCFRESMCLMSHSARSTWG